MSHNGVYKALSGNDDDEVEKNSQPKGQTEHSKGKGKSKESIFELLTTTPSGDCLVSTLGDLYCVHDLKHKLLGSNPDRVTLTLDMCRDRLHRGRNKQRKIFSLTLR